MSTLSVFLLFLGAWIAVLIFGLIAVKINNVATDKEAAYESAQALSTIITNIGNNILFYGLIYMLAYFLHSRSILPQICFVALIVITAFYVISTLIALLKSITLLCNAAAINTSRFSLFGYWIANITEILSVVPFVIVTLYIIE